MSKDGERLNFDSAGFKFPENRQENSKDRLSTHELERTLAAKVAELDGKFDGGPDLKETNGICIWPVYIPPEKALQFEEFLKTLGFSLGEQDDIAVGFADPGFYNKGLIKAQKYIPGSADEMLYRISDFSR